MLTEERVNLIEQNTSEIITKKELSEILERNKAPIVYCGYEPSGPVHLGHFVTMIKLMDFQKAGFKVKILLADLHAFLNKKGEEQDLEKEAEIWKKTIAALDLNAEVILGSSFQLEKAYQLDLMKIARNVTINRGLRSMQEIARDIDNATISQALYPLMQVLDIKYLNADVAEGGMEQRKVHMMGREIAQMTGHSFIAVHTPLITSLKGPGMKMSKSIPGSGISVIDSSEYIRKAIKNAYCPQQVLQNNPIMEIAKLIVFPIKHNLNITRPEKFGGDVQYLSYLEMESEFVGGRIHPSDLKNAISDSLEEIIANIRKKFE